MIRASLLRPEACMSKARFLDISLPKAKRRNNLGYKLMADTQSF
jgi:hypothetical protein